MTPSSNLDQYRKSTKHREATRGAIEEGTYKCISLLGYERTTMADIARISEISRSTLYRYYESVEDIVFGALESEVERFSNEISSRLTAIQDPRKQLVEGIILSITKMRASRWIALSQQLNIFGDSVFRGEIFRTYLDRAIEPIVKRSPALKKHKIELADFMLRQTISLLIYPGNIGTSETSLRAYLKGTVLPVYFD